MAVDLNLGSELGSSPLSSPLSSAPPSIFDGQDDTTVQQDSILVSAEGQNKTSSPDKIETSPKLLMENSSHDGQAPTAAVRRTSRPKRALPATAQAPAPVPAKKLKKAGTVVEKKADKKWDHEFVLSNEKSPLAKCDLRVSPPFPHLSY